MAKHSAEFMTGSRSRLLGIVATAIFLLMSQPVQGQQGPRSTIRFTAGWRFHLGDVSGAQQPAFDDSDWRPLDLPHDWSIEGTFDRDHPAGAGGGYLPGGVGWYRKTFTLPGSRRGKQVYIDFDGVYRNSEVWINGHYLGKRPFGYSSFRYELTPYLKGGDRENVIAVRVDNSEQPNSRWYSGSGIYRNVWLVITNKVHVAHWGTYVTTPQVNDEVGYVSVQTQVRNDDARPQDVTVITTIRDASGRSVAADSAAAKTIPADSALQVSQNMAVREPLLWSTEDPYLYTAVTTVTRDGQTVDRYTTPFGIRYFRFDADDGFFLNGKPVKIRGVCEHHDLGSLGAAVNKRAIERRLDILKSMGVNALRTAHNPPSPELLALTDEMGFLVLDEAFDVWRQKKTEYDYHQYWEQWHRRDLKTLIERDRNHPSVIMWSIGNEILEQWDSTGGALARELAGTVRALDDTRPITAGLNDPQPHNYVLRSGALDLVGYNYHNEEFADFPEAFPGQQFVATETASALATRGAYDMPSDSIRRWPTAWDKPFTEGNADFTVSSYDNVSTPWGSTHEEALRSIQSAGYLSGMFVWTGFDYIGEPTPYHWPARSSYFGIIDLSGAPKDAYYLYKSEWTDAPVLHLLPHWNWPEKDTVDVWAYTNAREVELYLNGRSLGRRKKTDDQMHLMWRVPWAPGTMKAVGRTKDGKQITDVVHTAGAPAQIKLHPDRKQLEANGRDLSFVRVTILDANGVVVPDADPRVEFEVTGPGTIAGVSSGDPTSHEPFKADHRRAFNGRCQVTIQATDAAGTITLRAQADGLKPATITLKTRKAE